MKKTVLILFGGKSPEHEISVKTAYNVLKALDKNLFNYILIGISRSGCFYELRAEQLENLSKNNQAINKKRNFKFVNFHPKQKKLEVNNKPVDVAFPLIHGVCGEDGNASAFFNMFNIPFVGNDTKSAAVSMDKDLTKKLLYANNVPVVPWLTFYKNESINTANIVKNLGLPVFIKSVEQGSSVGVYKASNEKEIEQFIEKSFQYGPKIIIEKAVNGRELEVGVLGNQNNIRISNPGEIVINPKYAFYSYDSKYIDPEGAKTVVNPKIDQDLINKIKSYAEKTFEVLECSGLTRIDMLVENNEQVYINEVNPMPGFAEISMYPKLWINEGLKYKELITQLIELGIEYFNEKQSYLLV